MNPLISAIIPTYNRADLLARALRSVAAQDYRPIEAVVVDDGSTDRTPQLIEDLKAPLSAQGLDLVFHRQRNGRAPRARNVGMKLAKGEFFAFLDSDDLWRPTFASTLLNLLHQHPSAGLAFCGIDVIDEEDRVWDVRKPGITAPSVGLLPRPFEQIMRHMPLQTSGVMVRRAVIDNVGDFDLQLPVVEDWDLWYRIAKCFDFAYTLAPLAANRSHPLNLPKYDITALSSGLRMNLKHLPDVTDCDTREMLLDRIQRQFTLLQEELLRHGKANNGYSHLLEHELAPRTPRFELGRVMARAPNWFGQSYAWAVRVLGELKRSAP